MSIFRKQTVTCPKCQAKNDFDTVYSVNADRRPDLRTAIIDGSFQRTKCPKCSSPFRLDPEMNFVNLGRKEWIAAFPIARFAEWQELSKQAEQTFAKAYGSKAPRSAQALGKELRPRVTFGWAALREKLVADDNQLDDVNLELVKMAVVRGLPNQPIDKVTELRLIRVEGNELVLAWITSATEQLVETLRTPRELYDEIVKDQVDWEPLRQELASGLFVDMLRLVLVTT